MPKVLNDALVESVADALAALLVAEWRAQHQGHCPPREVTITKESDAKSSTYGSDPDGQGPGPKPSTKARGSVRAFPGPRRNLNQP